MAGTYCSFDAKDAIDRCKKFIKAGGDMTPVTKAFGEYMLLQTDERFSGEHAPDGTRWQELSAATLATKKGDKILTESSGLRDTIIYSADAKRMAYGTNKVYGAIHQFSGVTGRGHKTKIPAREFLGITDENVMEFYETLKDHMDAN